MPARILIIEDNAANLDLMSYLLRAFGHTVWSSTDGEAGLQRLEHELPDLIVCDLQLPASDGFEVLRRVRGQPDWAKLPVVAVTALAMVGDQEKVLAAGFDGYISKPIDPEVFVPQIEQFLKASCRTRLPSLGATTPAPTAVPFRHRLLVVDDQVINLQLTRSIFEPIGYEVLTATGQEEGLSRARAQPLDLILSDVHMLDGDGYAFVREVQRDPRLQTVPVILITATYCDERSRARGLAAGAAGYLFRPIEPAALVAEVETVLRETKRSLSHGNHPDCR